MTNEELQYVDSLKNEISRLKDEVKNLTEETGSNMLKDLINEKYAQVIKTI